MSLAKSQVEHEILDIVKRWVSFEFTGVDHDLGVLPKNGASIAAQMDLLKALSHWGRIYMLTDWDKQHARNDKFRK